MKLVVKKEPWSRFLIKASIVLVVLVIAGLAFVDRYRIGIDTQLVKCIPGYTFYLIDRKDRSLEKGAIYSFAARGLDPFYEDGTQMVKFLRGQPGDRIKIHEQGNIYVNDELVGFGLVHAEQLGMTAENFVGEATLQEGSYWFMGTSDESFDSRYWGTVSDEQIIGRAYPIF